MSCEHVRELISPFLDGELPGKEREKVMAHAQSCRHCASTLEATQAVRSTLRPLAQTPVPTELASKLRVIASHEYHRRASRATLAGRLRLWLQPAQLFVDNLMRPMALPFAGGLFSALISFGVLVPTLTFQYALADTDLAVPYGEVIALSSNGTYSYMTGIVGGTPHIEPLSASSPADANVVELYIDQNGRVCDWAVRQGSLTPDLQSIIMLSQFQPPMFLGMPTSSRVKVVQPRATVRGVRG
jgi:anti-sigma factor (TIGR02949 family)